MGFGTNFKRSMRKKGLAFTKLSSSSELNLFLARFRAHYASCDLIRVGGETDGGYLVPDLLSDLQFCFSPGVADSAAFELDVAERYNITSFMADASVDGPPINNENFVFSKKFLGSVDNDDFMTLSSWVNQSVGTTLGNRLLQMDIEGSEYDVLVFEDADFLATFSVMIVEFHNFEKLFEKHFLKMTSAIFEKIYKNFTICHVHPNNCTPAFTFGGVTVPPVVEITFVRNDLLEKYKTERPLTLPHALDTPNVKGNPDYVLPPEWWKQK